MTQPSPPVVLPGLLSVYATPAGLAAIRAQFSDEQIWEVITLHTDNLLLAAADLLDALPAAAEGDRLASFKLDVLEFKYQAGSAGMDWAALALKLRAREAVGGGRRTANPAPEFDDWGLR